MPGNIDIPIREKPMRLLSDKKNCVRAVTLRQLPELVDIDRSCFEAAVVEAGPSVWP